MFYSPLLTHGTLYALSQECGAEDDLSIADCNFSERKLEISEADFLFGGTGETEQMLGDQGIDEGVQEEKRRVETLGPPRTIAIIKPDTAFNYFNTSIT